MVQNVVGKRPPVDLQNVEIAFKHLSRGELLRAYYLFSCLRWPWLGVWGSKLVKAALAMGLPVAWLVRKTLFKQFCGGESLEACHALTQRLEGFGVGLILDYAVEGKQREEDFDACCQQVRLCVDAAGDHRLPFVVFKVTALGRFSLLSKVSRGESLNGSEQEEWGRVRARVADLCGYAVSKKVRVLIDAEESWIQGAIDGLCEAMMAAHNRGQMLVYTTLQMYRHDRLAYLQELTAAAEQGGYQLGIKLVRGAYMEKERQRAERLAYQSPIYPNKEATDAAFDAALQFCCRHLATIALFAGTHNDQSTALMAALIDAQGLARDDERIVFGQLLGMSDHLSFNLAHAGYLAVKYVPFGPVKEALPYLIRRAEENSSLQSQSGRESTLLAKELARRRSEEARRQLLPT